MDTTAEGHRQQKTGLFLNRPRYQQRVQRGDLILPKDLYIFGDTVESSLVTIHECVPKRYCLRAN